MHGPEAAVRLADWLTSGVEEIAWAIAQVPLERRLARPPFGDWPPARHVFHLWHYEQHVALPSMRYLLGQSGPLDVRAVTSEEAGWRSAEAVEAVLDALRVVREAQCALLRAMPAGVWNRDQAGTVWGTTCLRWVVSKTVQHNAEHLSDILQLALFWDDAVR